MSAQRTRVEVMVENMANSEVTRTPEGGPYRRKEVVFSSAPQASQFASVLAEELSGSGVEVSEIVEDHHASDLRYMPGHPDANQDGYVAFPHMMNAAEDMVDMMGAASKYQTNVAAMSAVKDMIAKTIDLLKP